MQMILHSSSTHVLLLFLLVLQKWYLKKLEIVWVHITISSFKLSLFTFSFVFQGPENISQTIHELIILILWKNTCYFYM